MKKILIVEDENIIRNELKDEYDVEIVSLALWNSNMYSERPSIMNTENRIKQYMNDRFTQEMEYSDNEKYCELCYKENNRFGIKVTLFAMPLDNIENIKQ